MVEPPPAPLVSGVDAEELVDEVARVARQRGEGPECPSCGSGMRCDGTTFARDTSAERAHPFLRKRYYKCMNDSCRARISMTSQS